jgi:hypothetical protein
MLVIAMKAGRHDALKLPACHCVLIACAAHASRGLADTNRKVCQPKPLGPVGDTRGACTSLSTAQTPPAARQDLTHHQPPGARPGRLKASAKDVGTLCRPATSGLLWATVGTTPHTASCHSKFLTKGTRPPAYATLSFPGVAVAGLGPTALAPTAMAPNRAPMWRGFDNSGGTESPVSKDCAAQGQRLCWLGLSARAHQTARGPSM